MFSRHYYTSRRLCTNFHEFLSIFSEFFKVRGSPSIPSKKTCWESYAWSWVNIRMVLKWLKIAKNMPNHVWEWFGTFTKSLIFFGFLTHPTSRSGLWPFLEISLSPKRGPKTLKNGVGGSLPTSWDASFDTPLAYIRTIWQSDYRTIGLSDYRTIGLSDYRFFFVFFCELPHVWA